MVQSPKRRFLSGSILFVATRLLSQPKKYSLCTDPVQNPFSFAVAFWGWHQCKSSPPKRVLMCAAKVSMRYPPLTANASLTLKMYFAVFSLTAS